MSLTVPTKFSVTRCLSFYISIIFSYSFFIDPFFFLCSEIQWSQKNVIFHLYLKSILLLLPLSLFYLHLKYCPAPAPPCTVLHLIPSHFASEMCITVGIPLPWVRNSTGLGRTSPTKASQGSPMLHIYWWPQTRLICSLIGELVFGSSQWYTLVDTVGLPCCQPLQFFHSSP